MWPVLFQSEGFIVFSYPLFLGLAWGVGYRLSEARLPKEITPRAFAVWMLGVFLFSWLGAKLLFLMTQNRWQTQELLGASQFWLGGGFVFLGGLLGGGIFAALIGLRYPSLHWREMGFVMIPLLWGHSIGRIGCWLAGCCFGAESELPWALHLHGVGRHPVQLYEALALATLALILERSPRRDLLGHYLLGYGIIRFSLEFFRGDEVRGFVLGLSTSQALSLLLVVLGACLYLRRQVTEKTS